MGDRIEFDINEALKLYLSDPATISTIEASPELLDCENEPENLTYALVGPILEQINDAVAENPESLSYRANFDSIQFLLK
jgi:condensin complex subunit 1